jgi:Sad1 / UNC-like C-terminal
VLLLKLGLELEEPIDDDGAVDGGWTADLWTDRKGNADDSVNNFQSCDETWLRVSSYGSAIFHQTRNMMVYRRRLWFLVTAALPWLVIPASSTAAEGNEFLPAVLEVEKALLKHPVDEDLAAWESELDASIESAQAKIRQAVAATIKDRESIALHNREVIDATIAELELTLAAVSRKRQLEKTSLDNEALLTEQVQQMERQEQDTIYHAISKTIRTVVNATDFSTPCLTASMAATAVHQGLRSYVGAPDLLQIPGTKIIQQLTAATYDPPIAERAPLFRLGDWSRYMPDDIEAILTLSQPYSGRWQNWTIPNIIPTHVWHSLGMSSGGGTSGSRSSLTSAPPQAILQPLVHPGHCWPSVKPKVVIQLAAPAVLSTITIDHVSAALVSKNERTSAPKHIQVYSYSPIATTGGSGSNTNNGLSFDRSSRKLLLEGNFDASSGVSSVQSFPVNGVEDAVNHGDGSCATVVPSCESGITVSAAIEVVVLSNWGNPDYTCIYRVRAHGNVV